MPYCLPVSVRMIDFLSPVSKYWGALQVSPASGWLATLNKV
jgi:hypothetical protein